MTEPLDETADGHASARRRSMRVLGVPRPTSSPSGPGLGSGGDVAAFVHGLLERAGVPLVLDADALNALRRRSGPPGRRATARS